MDINSGYYFLFSLGHSGCGGYIINAADRPEGNERTRVMKSEGKRERWSEREVESQREREKCSC